MLKFLGHRINAPNRLRLFARFLKNGYMEEGKFNESDKGTPQGGIVSPMQSNIYLHEVLDEWFVREIQPRMEGKSFMVRFSDNGAGL